MLTLAKNRYTAKQVLASKWLKIKLKDSDDFNIYNLDYKQISRYKNYNKFKQAVLTFIASRLNSEETTKIRNIFNNIDEDKKGFITYEDFTKYIINECNIDDLIDNEEELKKAFQSVDIDHNNKIVFKFFFRCFTSTFSYILFFFFFVIFFSFFSIFFVFCIISFYWIKHSIIFIFNLSISFIIISLTFSFQISFLLIIYLLKKEDNKNKQYKNNTTTVILNTINTNSSNISNISPIIIKSRKIENIPTVKNKNYYSKSSIFWHWLVLVL